MPEPHLKGGSTEGGGALPLSCFNFSEVAYCCFKLLCNRFVKLDGWGQKATYILWLSYGKQNAQSYSKSLLGNMHIRIYFSNRNEVKHRDYIMTDHKRA